MNNSTNKYNNRNSNLVFHLIKSCENYDLSEKESIETINKILGKSISRRTYYNYKKKLYDKEIFHQLKDSIYDNHMARCLLLNSEETDWKKSLKADFLVYQQLPDREDIFNDTSRQIEELEELEEIKSRIDQFEKPLNESLQRYEEVPKNAKTREEFIKCGKEKCNDCPHGPYYYAYWKDTTTKKLKKKYIGRFDPSR
jgi:hypothetical protein